MKRLFYLFTILTSAAHVYGQTINNPESVEYDAANGRYLISNRATPVSIQSLIPGQSPTLFATGVSSPAGLEILNGKLWVCDGANIKSFNLSTGALENTINVGGVFLNGITSDGSQFLFVSDFSANKIYRINTVSLTSNVMVNSTGTQPNGMWYDGANNRLIFVSWGGSAPIKAISLADSTVSTIMNTTLGNCDGIARDGQGRYYVSSWSQSGVYRFDSDFTSQQQVLSGVSQGADIFYNTLNDTLAIPRTSGDAVTFHYFGSAGLESGSGGIAIDVFPNPAVDLLKIDFGTFLLDEIEINLTDANGKQLDVKSLIKEKQNGVFVMNVEDLPRGAYFLKLTIGENNPVIRQIQLR